jgi:hypothetical protein
LTNGRPFDAERERAQPRFAGNRKSASLRAN